MEPTCTTSRIALTVHSVPVLVTAGRGVAIRVGLRVPTFLDALQHRTWSSASLFNLKFMSWPLSPCPAPQTMRTPAHGELELHDTSRSSDTGTGTAPSGLGGIGTSKLASTTVGLFPPPSKAVAGLSEPFPGPLSPFFQMRAQFILPEPEGRPREDGPIKEEPVGGIMPLASSSGPHCQWELAGHKSTASAGASGTYCQLDIKGTTPPSSPRHGTANYVNQEVCASVCVHHAPGRRRASALACAGKPEDSETSGTHSTGRDKGTGISRRRHRAKHSTSVELCASVAGGQPTPPIQGFCMTVQACTHGVGCDGAGAGVGLSPGALKAPSSGSAAACTWL